MSDKRQKNQLMLAFAEEYRGEAPNSLTDKPQPVKRVEIPKPDRGIRKPGIPTVLDRFIQRAVMQVLQGRGDRTFSEHSYGFRPGRPAHQAVEQAQKYIAAGFGAGRA